MKIIKEKYSFAMRWFHWINFPILTIMICFPVSFYKFLGVPFRLAEGMAWHFMFMWLFTINGVLYVLYTWLSGAWRELIPRRNSFREAWQVILHDLHIRRFMPPQNKYNAAQRIAYSMIIVMGFVEGWDQIQHWAE